MKEFCIIIPAVKKNVAFPDDLVKKLDGVMLIERSIAKARNIAPGEDIFVVTDSQEIDLIAQRQQVECVYEKNLRLQGSDILKDLPLFFSQIRGRYRHIIVLWPYTPLLPEDELRRAYDAFKKDGCHVMVSVKEEKHRVYSKGKRDFEAVIFDDDEREVLVEVKAFKIFHSELTGNNGNGGESLKILPYFLGNDVQEIRSYQDWWVCDKLLKRKRIVFHVIGYDEVGMGHVYRSLSLAHEIADHEIIFVCDKKSRIAVNKIAGYDYRVEFVESGDLEGAIIGLEPDMVINDVLNTEKRHILRLKENNIKVVNFEDLGSGAAFADLTINELYDRPLIDADNIKWGYEYFFLRDEFSMARRHEPEQGVRSLLITFGGTDPNNITLNVLKTVADYCEKAGISVYVVVGPGYLFRDELGDFLASRAPGNIVFADATGIMSAIMEKCQAAISSNGRTVYELAHMNIPSIIISQHKRENTHGFACEENGFLNVGVYEDGVTEMKALETLVRLVEDSEYRKGLQNRMKPFDFTANKKKVTKIVLELLEDER